MTRRSASWRRGGTDPGDADDADTTRTGNGPADRTRAVGTEQRGDGTVAAGAGNDGDDHGADSAIGASQATAPHDQAPEVDAQSPTPRDETDSEATGATRERLNEAIAALKDVEAALTETTRG